MDTKQHNQQKLLNDDTLLPTLERLRKIGKKIVFTNGCFDILHPGHIHTLQEAAALGDYLLVAINSDASVKRLKGTDRPVNTQDARALVMAALSMVDGVCIFDEDTPLQLIQKLLPDVLVKGGDYQAHEVVGCADVTAHGGKVAIIPYLEGYSTTTLIDQIKS